MAAPAAATPRRCNMAASRHAAAASGRDEWTARRSRGTRTHQGHHDRRLCHRRHPRIAAAAGAGGFLGAVVRPVQAADAGAGKGGPRGGRQGQAGQDEHRRSPVDRRPARHPVDSGGHRLQERPAGRRLHGRHSRKPDPRIPGEGDRQGRRRRAGRSACRRRRGARGRRYADGGRHLFGRARANARQRRRGGRAGRPPVRRRRRRDGARRARPRARRQAGRLRPSPPCAPR